MCIRVLGAEVEPVEAATEVKNTREFVGSALGNSARTHSQSQKAHLVRHRGIINTAPCTCPWA